MITNLTVWGRRTYISAKLLFIRIRRKYIHKKHFSLSQTLIMKITPGDEITYIYTHARGVAVDDAEIINNLLWTKMSQ